MKIRVFKNICNSVVRVVINTEDFSCDEVKLMCQFGEPEVNVGGEIQYSNGSERAVSDGLSESLTLGDEYVRIMHGFPYARGFDIRDFDGEESYAMAAANAWQASVVQEISRKMTDLRESYNIFPTEEVVNV